MPNRLTLLYSKIYYKEENYLKVRTAVFKYITPFYSKGSVHPGSVYWYIKYSKYITFLYSKTLYILISFLLYNSATLRPIVPLVLYYQPTYLG